MNDGYDECRSLYRAARAEEVSSQADRHAVRVGIAASLAAGVHAAAAGATAATAGAGNAAGASALGAKGIVHLLLGGKFVSEVVIGVAIGAAVSTTVLVVQKTRPPTTAAVNEQARTSPVAVQPRVVSEGPAKLQAAQTDLAQPAQETEPQRLTAETSNAVIAVESAIARPHAAARDPAAGAGEPAAPVAFQDRLVEETQALAKVQEALNRKDPSLAWSLLQQQERQFASGQLGQERAAAQIMTLCAAGQTALADQARTVFLANYPKSPLAKRIKQGCDR